MKDNNNDNNNQPSMTYSKSRELGVKQLTVLFVQENFHLHLLVVFQATFNFRDACPISHFAIHESTATRFLHHLGAIVARDLAKRFGAVDDWKVHNLGVGQQKTAIG